MIERWDNFSDAPMVKDPTGLYVYWEDAQADKAKAVEAAVKSAIREYDAMCVADSLMPDLVPLPDEGVERFWQQSQARRDLEGGDGA